MKNLTLVIFTDDSVSLSQYCDSTQETTNFQNQNFLQRLKKGFDKH